MVFCTTKKTELELDSSRSYIFYPLASHILLPTTHASNLPGGQVVKVGRLVAKWLKWGGWWPSG